MLWYGSRSNFSKLPQSSTNKSNLFFLKKKKNSINFFRRSVYSICSFFLYIPSLWNFSVFKSINKNSFFIFFYSKNYFFFLPVNSSLVSFKINKNSSTISFLYFYRNIFFFTFFSYFKKIFYIFTKLFFKKLKFKGKGYYIYKTKRNTIAFQFGYSHIRRLFLFCNFVKFLSKTSILMFGLNPWILSKSSKKFKQMRPINIFTGKGVRFNKQIVYRKTGKVSSYR